MKRIIYSTIVSLLMLTGCSDFFDPDTDEILLEKEYIGDYSEIYSGYMGLAACVQGVVDQAIFLEGLRGILLEPTENATPEMWDIYNYVDELKSNSLANPKGFYNLILNANDFLEHILEYREKNPTVLTEEYYDGIIGGALRYKAWAYFMLAKIYGEAIYMDEPLISEVDLSQYPKLGFDQLIDKCIDLIEVGQGGVNGLADMRWSTALFPGQGASPTNLQWNRICPPADCLLAELYLFKAARKNNSAEQNKTYYQKAWNHCIEYIKIGGAEQSFQLNASTYDSGWKGLFSAAEYDRQDHISVAFYDYTLKQTNRLIDYFSDNAPNKYYLRPSQVAMERWPASGLNDDNYRGDGASYMKGTQGWLFSKYIRYHHNSSNLVFRNDIFISYYRASDLYFWLTEACAGLGRYFEAWTFLNGGIGGYYNAGISSFIEPFTDYPTTLAVVPGKEGQGANRGIRGRVSAPSVGNDLVIEAQAKANPELSPEYLTHAFDSLLVEESFLELAGEARSYYMMVRMGMKYGDEERARWAATIAEKYPDGGASVRGKLESDINNWFIKYDLKLND